MKATFHDLVMHDEPAAAYLADVLTRFARTDALFPRGVADTRLETVVDMLLEAQAVWDHASVTFQPEREVSVRRHIGDYTLFMTGVFPERVARVASTRYYVDQGKRAYHFVSEYDRASRQPTGRSLYRRLAERFERYMAALDYARRVHFAQHPSRPFFGAS